MRRAMFGSMMCLAPSSSPGIATATDAGLARNALAAPVVVIFCNRTFAPCVVGASDRWLEPCRNGGNLGFVQRFLLQ